MSPAKPALEEVSGYLGVGSLELPGVFFLVDGPTNFVPFAETILKTSTWTLFATVPLLVVSYVLGLISSIGAEAALSRIIRPVLTSVLFALASASANEMLI